MYLIYRTKSFEKSYKKVRESGYLTKQVEENLKEIIDTLAKGDSLPNSYRDHQLKGELRHYRECHIKGDLLLIYQLKKQELFLVLVDIGTHAQLGI